MGNSIPYDMKYEKYVALKVHKLNGVVVLTTDNVEIAPPFKPGDDIY